MADFTLSAYLDILKAAQKAGYNIGTVSDLLSGDIKPPFVILRHDIDRRPANALQTAKEEALLGVRASYFFRSVKASFRPYIIQQIDALGHEIGYHYEDWFLARYDKNKAKDLFETNLKKLNSISNVKTICMHGSPLSRDNNMEIWNHWNFEDYGLKDCILSYDYTNHAFFTDSGRTFGVSGANLRDELGNAQIFPDVKSTQDLCDFLENKRCDKIMISVHPERWNNNPILWVDQFIKDMLVNIIKHTLKAIRK